MTARREVALRILAPGAATLSSCGGLGWDTRVPYSDGWDQILPDPRQNFVQYAPRVRNLILVATSHR